MIGKISGVITDMSEEFSQVSVRVDTQPVDVKQLGRAPRASNVRASLTESGVTHAQVRDRLNCYVAEMRPGSRHHALKGAVRFMQWYTGEQTIGDLVVSQGITLEGIRRSFDKLAGVALNHTYNSEHTLGDIIGFTMENPVESKNSQKRTAGLARAGMIGVELASVDNATRQRAVLPGETSLDDPILSWQADALCAQTDPEAFFPEKGESTEQAKKVCAVCKVQENCRAYALSNDEKFGVWGGLSESELRQITSPNYLEDTA